MITGMLMLFIKIMLNFYSCTPNVSMIFDGFKVYIRPLTQDISPYDVKKSFISYIDVGRSK